MKKEYEAKKHDLSKSAGAGYKKGTTKGDIEKHKRENLRIRLGK